MTETESLNEVTLRGVYGDIGWTTIGCHEGGDIVGGRESLDSLFDVTVSGLVGMSPVTSTP